MLHTVKGFGIVNKAEIDVFLELSCFFNDSMDVGLEWVNLTQMTILSTTMDKNPLEEMG